MSPFSILTRVLTAIDRLRSRDPFTFWATIYVSLFALPFAWTVATDLVSWYAPVTPGTAALLWLADKSFGG